MCGFVGAFNKQITPNIDLAKAAASIYSRGPDMCGIESGNYWKVAFNRLSIHDLTDKGMQPFKHEDVTVYMNGEVYNYIELENEHKNEYTCRSGSDVEIIPFLYKKYGLKFLDMLNGMFAIVLIDEGKKTNYLIRDRFGKKPLYYHKDNDNLLFASEVKAIKKLKKLEVDKTNIQINFACWFLPQPLTLYKNTFNVNPGSYLEYKNGNLVEKQWYNPKIKKNNDSEKEIEKNFIELYNSSISLRLRSDVPTGLFLSGGLDSTSIAKFSYEKIGKNFKAFTAKITGKEKFESTNTDVDISSKLSNDLGIENIQTTLDYNFYNKNIIKIISNYDEIFVNSGVLVFYALAKAAKENNTSVIMTGVGGDELFGGYPWQSMKARRINNIFLFLYNKIPYSEYLYKIFLKFNRKIAYVYKMLSDYGVWHAQTLVFNLFFNRGSSDKKAYEKRLRALSKNYFNTTNKSFEFQDTYNAMHYADIFTVMGGQNYLADMGCMNSSVENRSPFEDYRIFEYMMSIPDEIKIKYGQKGLLRKIFTKHLPSYITTAKKSGPTMPIDMWFWENGKIKAEVKFFVDANLNLISKYLSQEISNSIKTDINWLYDAKHSLRIFAIISFIIWCKINISQELKNFNIEFEQLLNYEK
ncbi:MAG: asparagine synthase (glutamine-hydrolyzing) [Sulfurimonas sp.]|nr:asparagine synthase (glutamine-hydrolyzing) [Sulfurimonas sp.]